MSTRPLKQSVDGFIGGSMLRGVLEAFRAMTEEAHHSGDSES